MAGLFIVSVIVNLEVDRVRLQLTGVVDAGDDEAVERIFVAIRQVSFELLSGEAGPKKTAVLLPPAVLQGKRAYFN